MGERAQGSKVKAEVEGCKGQRAVGKKLGARGVRPRRKRTVYSDV